MPLRKLIEFLAGGTASQPNPPAPPAKRQRVTLDALPMDGTLCDIVPFGEFIDPQGRLYGYVPPGQTAANSLAMFAVVDWDHSHPVRIFLFRVIVRAAPGDEPQYFSAVTTVASLASVEQQLAVALEEATKNKSAASVYTLYTEPAPDQGTVVLHVDKEPTAGDMCPVSVTVTQDGNSATAVFTRLADFEKFVAAFSVFKTWILKPPL